MEYPVISLLHILLQRFQVAKGKGIIGHTRKTYAHRLCIMAETWYWEQVWLQTVVSTFGLLLYRYAFFCRLIRSRVKNVQCRNTILILASKPLIPLIGWQLMVLLCHMLLLLSSFLSDFTSQFPLSVSSGLFMMLIQMDVFQCEMTQPGVNVDHPLPPTAAIWWAGGKAWGSSGEAWESWCVDDATPLSNWGNANMITQDLKNDQHLPPRRRFAVIRVLLRELLRGTPEQFNHCCSNKNHVTAQHTFVPSSWLITNTTYKTE